MIKKFCSNCGEKTSAGCGCNASAHKDSCGMKDGCGMKGASEHEDSEFEPEKSAYVKAVRELRAIANKVYENKTASVNLRKIAMELEELI